MSPITTSVLNALTLQLHYFFPSTLCPQGRPAKNYIDILEADTGDGSSELPELIENREEWKTIVNSAQAHWTE